MGERSDSDSSDSEDSIADSESEGGDISSSLDEEDSENDTNSESAHKNLEESINSVIIQDSSNIEDEYEFDSSDEEDIRNTVGNVPMQWYKDYDHIGYDLAGKKIMKPGSGNEIDNFLAKMDDPNYWFVLFFTIF